MPARTRLLTVAAMLVAAATPALAQQPSSVLTELVSDVNSVETKLVNLAREMPAASLEWRPGDGVRSVGEVFLHIAADNYLLPAATGTQPPPASGIDPGDFATLTAYEKQKMTQPEMIAMMQESFAHLRAAMESTSEARLSEQVKFFGQDMTVRQVWLLTALHLHEHLGQLIAYARMNNVTPPWSRATQ